MEIVSFHINTTSSEITCGWKRGGGEKSVEDQKGVEDQRGVEYQKEVEDQKGVEDQERVEDQKKGETQKGAEDQVGVREVQLEKCWSSGSLSSYFVCWKRNCKLIIPSTNCKKLQTKKSVIKSYIQLFYCLRSLNQI